MRNFKTSKLFVKLPLKEPKSYTVQCTYTFRPIAYINIIYLYRTIYQKSGRMNPLELMECWSSLTSGTLDGNSWKKNSQQNSKQMLAPKLEPKIARTEPHNKHGRTDGLTDGRADGRTDWRMDGRAGGRTDWRTNGPKTKYSKQNSYQNSHLNSHQKLTPSNRTKNLHWYA